MSHRDELVGALLAQAQEQRAAGQSEAAMSLLHEAASLVSTSAAHWFTFGREWRALGQDEEARVAFARAAMCDPFETALAWFEWGHELNVFPHYAEALAAFEQALMFVPDEPMFWICKGMVLGNMGTFMDPSYHQAAVEALDQALTLHPEPRQERVALGLKAKSLYGLGRGEEARPLSERSQRMYEAEQREQKQ